MVIHPLLTPVRCWSRCPGRPTCRRPLVACAQHVAPERRSEAVTVPPLARPPGSDSSGGLADTPGCPALTGDAPSLPSRSRCTARGSPRSRRHVPDFVGRRASHAVFLPSCCRRQTGRSRARVASGAAFSDDRPTTRAGCSRTNCTTLAPKPLAVSTSFGPTFYFHLAPPGQCRCLTS